MAKSSFDNTFPVTSFSDYNQSITPKFDNPQNLKLQLPSPTLVIDESDYHNFTEEKGEEETNLQSVNENQFSVSEVLLMNPQIKNNKKRKLSEMNDDANDAGDEYDESMVMSNYYIDDLLASIWMEKEYDNDRNPVYPDERDNNNHLESPTEIVETSHSGDYNVDIPNFPVEEERRGEVECINNAMLGVNYNNNNITMRVVELIGRKQENRNAIFTQPKLDNNNNNNNNLNNNNDNVSTYGWELEMSRKHNRIIVESEYALHDVHVTWEPLVKDREYVKFHVETKATQTSSPSSNPLKYEYTIPFIRDYSINFRLKRSLENVPSGHGRSKEVPEYPVLIRVIGDQTVLFSFRAMMKYRDRTVNNKRK